jgi:cation transporter-like permease
MQVTPRRAPNGPRFEFARIGATIWMEREPSDMKLVRSILVSTAVGLLSAIVGWFAGYLIGSVFDPPKGLGSGLPTFFLMCLLALVFGVIGFLVCLVRASKRTDSRKAD